MKVPFRDGVLDIPDHIAELMRAQGIPTIELTHEQALEQLDMANLRTVVNRAADRIIGDHMKVYG